MKSAEAYWFSLNCSSIKRKELKTCSQPEILNTLWDGNLLKGVLTVMVYFENILMLSQRHSDNLDLPDDEELAQAFDMHAMILNTTDCSTDPTQDPVVTADQVIEEIDEIFQVRRSFNTMSKILC